MKAYKEIFEQDIELPNVVLQKMDDAFAMIQAEDKKTMVEVREISHAKSKKRVFKGQMAAVACVSVLVVGSITAVAAIHHYWSRGMQGTLQATEEQQQELVEQGMAEVLTEQKTYEELAVTVGNVTVTPTMVIADEKCAHVSFCVEGYSVGKNIEPIFDITEVYLGDDPNAEEGWLNMNASFYDGIVIGEDGSPMYDDGTPMQYEDGNSISRYEDENGNLEFVVSAHVVGAEDSLLGKTMHVNLKNLGIMNKAEYTNVMDGDWEFEITLPDTSMATHVQVGKIVPDTVFTIDSIELSPISIKINYIVNGEVAIEEDCNGIPHFSGAVLKDGTRLPYLGDGSMTGYTDEQMIEAYLVSEFDRVIEPNEVVALLLRPEDGGELIEVPIGE